MYSLNFGIFTFLNSYFFQYFVGTCTSDTLSVQMTCLLAYMYRQIFNVADLVNGMWKVAPQNKKNIFGLM